MWPVRVGRNSVSTHFLATPLGKSFKKSSSTMSKSAEINADNIIRPSLDELSEEHRQAYEAIKKQRQEQRMEAYEALMKQREEEDLQVFLANFDKTRQEIGRA